MTFHLTEPELQSAYDAIEHHGYSALLPTPPEWKVVQANWDDIRRELTQIDMDTYTPVRPLRVYAPKTRATVRVVSLLHPIDLIFYTALTLIAKDDLERARVPLTKRVVFSYRGQVANPSRLYGPTPTFAEFSNRLDLKSNAAKTRFIAVADIADFYPRIYQHRLENAVESAATSQRTRDVARVLVRKLIGNLSGNNSYGIPVGPYASRVLAEAVLVDVDSYLISERCDFIRWVDDYYFFTSTEQDAQEILIRLAQRLYEKHGLTLSSLKTKIQGKATFRRRFEVDPAAVVDERIQRVRDFSGRFDPYMDEEIELSEEEVAELQQLELAELISEALEDTELVDYDTIASILKHPEVLSRLPVDARKALGETLLDNIEHLYPIAAEVARFFSLFSDYAWKDRKKIKAKLLRSLLPKRGKWPPDYYLMWVLSVFGESDAWRESPEYARLFRDHRSDLVRRMSALAIAANGSRADALETKDSYEAASRLEQCSILLASHKLGKDERRHWKTSLQVIGVLEKRL